MKRSRLYRIDLREKQKYENLKYNNFWMGVIVLEVLITLVVFGYLKSIKKTLPQALETPIIINAVESTKPYCKDVVECIRDIGENQNHSNKTIMTMIRIAKKESNYNEKAKNKSSTARGVFQILAGTWYSNNCIGDPLKFEDNITCAYKILNNQGFPAWEVCNNGSAKCY